MSFLSITKCPIRTRSNAASLIRAGRVNIANIYLWPANGNIRYLPTWTICDVIKLFHSAVIDYIVAN